uniref:Uncharacterized protein n=1 Tax=Oryza sativa subsp. japonica TaxID=39947 RepID=Q2QV88_ORYSJ|nr:hypothetical protein LOC_Os12g13650 [Oryza sativa Japonica Group]
MEAAWSISYRQKLETLTAFCELKFNFKVFFLGGFKLFLKFPDRLDWKRISLSYLRILNLNYGNGGSPHSTFEDSKIGTIAGDARLFGHALAWPPRWAPGVSKRTARVPQRPVGHATEHHGVGVGAWRSCWHPRRVDVLRDRRDDLRACELHRLVGFLTSMTGARMSIV